MHIQEVNPDLCPHSLRTSHLTYSSVGMESSMLVVVTDVGMFSPRGEGGYSTVEFHVIRRYLLECDSYR